MFLTGTAQVNVQLCNYGMIDGCQQTILGIGLLYTDFVM